MHIVMPIARSIALVYLATYVACAQLFIKSNRCVEYFFILADVWGDV